MFLNAPKLSFVVIFHNMQREAPRTLFSLSRQYQNCDSSFKYEVIAIDNGSASPLAESLVKSFGNNFHYHYFSTESVSPVDAINYGVSIAKGRLIAINIDGARILSPGIISSIASLSEMYRNPFAYTLGFHLGPKVQNESILDGYNQTAEDELLEQVDWQSDGYELFKISSLARSSASGYFGPMAESNCFSLPKRVYEEIGGFDPRFQSPGGGLANLDIFEKACAHQTAIPVCLLGEGTFHQFHGGVATNVELEHHPMEDYQEEFARIHGRRWSLNPDLQPVYFGRIPKQARRFVLRN